MNLYNVLSNRYVGMSNFERLFAQKFGGSGGEIKELEGVPPLTFKANGQPLLDYLIKGNMEQSGTPTPSSPIYPSECGERTENLFDIKKVKQSDLLLVSGTTITKSATSFNYDIFSNSSGASANISTSCMVLEAGTYILSFETIEGQLNMFQIAICPYTSETMSVETQYTDGYNGKTFVLSEKSYVTLRIRKYEPQSVKNLMINLGSTAPTSYIPYGYKLPITLGDMTTNIYLGEVQSTRRIKKLVLTGTEIWLRQANSHTTCINLYTAITSAEPSSAIISNIVTYNSSAGVGNDSIVNVGKINNNGTYLLMDMDLSDFATADDWRSYLAAQYAAGTPVTVWYVLAEPETGIVNEPLMKIGDYADTISMEQAGVSIPTNKGSNTLNVDTTLKPSNVYIKYKS